MSEQQKVTKQNNLLWIILAIAMVAFGAYSFLTSDLQVMEDLNGPDNYELAVITDDNIIKQDMGAMGLKMSSSFLNDGITFSSKNFNGVARIFLTNFLFDSDFHMDVMNFYINSGNFRMCIVNEGKIICDVTPGELITEVLLEDINGSFELVIAGESADFTFYLEGVFCERYGITIGE